MGYECPVCGEPHGDGEHLANHLAFAAMLHGDPHEGWLDERVPDWADRDPAGLAPEVTPHAAETDYESVFEDTVRRSSGPGRTAGDVGRPAAHDTHGGKALDAASEDALREARELTRRMLEPDDGETGDDGDAAADRGDDAGEPE